MLTLATIKDEANVFSTVPVVSLLTSSKIHLDLSNVWNDYKVEKIALTATPLGVEDLITEEDGVLSGPREYLKLFCAWDNNDVNRQLRYSDIKTYESYQDVTYSITASNEAPILRFSTDPKMKKMDTKKTPNYGTLIIGINSPIIFDDSVDINISVNFTFTVCYGCPRLDTSWVSTLIAPEFRQLPDSRVQTVEVPVPVPTKWAIDTIIIRGPYGEIGTYELGVPPFIWHSAGSPELTFPDPLKKVISIGKRPGAIAEDDDDDFYYVLNSFYARISGDVYYLVYPITVEWEETVTRYLSNGRQIIVHSGSGDMQLDTDLVSFPNLPNLQL